MQEARRTVRFAAIIGLLVAVTGVIGVWIIRKYAWQNSAMMYGHFSAFEPAGIAIFAFAAIVVFIAAGRDRGGDAPAPRWLADSRASRLGLALAVLVVVLAGTRAVFENFPFMDDEYSGVFQAAIYANGQSQAAVAAPWCEWIKSLTPTSIAINGCSWRLSYFPVNALVRGAFMAAHLQWLMHPLIAALSVLFVVDFCRRAWPDQPERPMLAGLFLAASSQFLLMSMTAFSMPAHLLASAAWLWLWIRPDRWALALLPIVGVVAVGVHSPYPHILFAAPLILRYLTQRRFAAFAYVTMVYAAGCFAWILWLRQPTAGGSAADASAMIGRTASAFSVLHPIGDSFASALSTVVLATWNVPIALVCIFVAMLSWRRLDPLARWLAFGLLVTLVTRAVFFGMYGMGWGHRYAHAVLPNFAVLAAVGAGLMAQAMGRRRAYRLVGGALAVAILGLLPLRGWQAHQYVAPYARASAYIARVPADVVLFQFQSVMWGRQLLRNDPFLRLSPKLMDINDLTPDERDAVIRAFPGRVHEMRPEELAAFGVPLAPRIGRFQIRR